MSAAYKVVYSLLSNHVGYFNASGGRIYANVAQQGAAYPLCVISGIGRVESPTQDDDSAIDTYRIQLDLFAEDSPTASGIATLTNMAEQARDALARVTGTVEGILVNGIQSAGEGDDYDRDLKLHRKRLDFQIRITL